MAFATTKRTHSEQDHRVRVAAALAVVAVLAGALVARGGVLVYAVLSMVAVTAVATLFARNVFRALLVWLAAEGVAYPFLRYPYYHDVATFDRLVIVSLGGALLLVGSRALSKDARRLSFAFGLFVLAYGLRALFTRALPPPPGYPATIALAPIANWLDHVLLPFIVFVAAARAIATAERWRSAAGAFVVLGVSIALLGMLEWGTGISLAEYAGLHAFVDTAAGITRVTGPYADPSAYGGVLLTCIAATFYWMAAERQLALGGAAVLIQVLALGPIFTKTVWGAGFVVVIMMLGLRSRASTRTILVLVYSTVVIGILYTLTRSSPIIAARLSGSNNNIYARIGDYSQAISIFRHWPLFGAGIAQYIPAQSIVAPAYYHGVRAALSPHDTFVSVLGESGLLGFVPLTFLVFALVKVIRACRRAARTLEEVLFGVTVLTATTGYLLLSLTFTELASSPATAVLAIVLGAAAGRLRTVAEPKPAPESRRAPPRLVGHLG